MKKSKHTPGPWQIGEGLSCRFWKKIINLETRVVVADVKVMYSYRPELNREEEGMANARLIATSPILLTELSNLIEACLKKVETSDIRNELMNAQHAVSMAKGNIPLNK